MKKRYPLLGLLSTTALLLAGCGQPATPALGSSITGTSSKQQYLGRLDLQVGTGAQLPASSDVKIASFPGYGVYQITRVLVPGRTYDDPVTQRRYSQTTYELKNISTSPLVNFTFYAAHGGTYDVGGTAYHSNIDSNKVAITDPALIQSIRPENGWAASAFKPDPLYSDFQAFAPQEAVTLFNAIKASGNAGPDETVLEYGWVARAEGSNSHVIPPGGLGQVTFAYSSPISANIYSNRISLEVSVDDAVRVTRAYGESTSSAVSRAQAAGATQVALIGMDADTALGYNTIRLPSPMLYVGQNAVVSPPSITLSTPISNVGKSVDFSVDAPGAQSVQWNFTDGGTASGAAVSHTFTTKGLYSATATITMPDGSASQATQQVSVLPEIQDLVSSRATSDSMTVSFDAGDPLPGYSYSLDFGDGSSANTSRASHTYTQIGTYDYHLVIRDTNAPVNGQRLHTQSLDNTVVYDQTSWHTIWRRAPKASFTIQGMSSPIAVGKVGVTPTFDASASVDPNTTPSSLAYTWDFGDNTSGTGVTAQHTYGVMGRYPVTLTVTNAFGLSDTYHNVVQVRDPKSNFKINVEQANSVAGQSVADSNIAPAALKALSANSDALDYFPYIIPSTNKIKSALFSSLNLDGTVADSYCSQLTANQNGMDVFVMKTEKPQLGTDGAGNAIFCSGLVYTAGIRMKDLPISSFFVTSSRYINDMRFSVFSKLSVPKVLLGVYPDEYISGNVASPSVKEFTTINPSTGKTEWLMQVNVRQSELNNGAIKLKIPVMALDANGAFESNATGRFKATFGDGSLQSDCGDCTMINGRGYITITLPVSTYLPSQQTLNLSSIVLGTDNSCAQTDMWTTANFRFTGCSSMNTTNEYPTTRAPIINAHPYPPSATLLGHVFYGNSADAVKALKIYGQIGYATAHTMVSYSAPYLLTSEHREELSKVTDALYADGKLSLKERGQLLLANIGFVGSFFPQASKPSNFLSISTASNRGLGFTAKAMEETLDVSKTTGKLTSETQQLLEVGAGTTYRTIETCGEACVALADDAASFIISNKGVSAKDALTEYDSLLKDIADSNKSSEQRLQIARGRTLSCNLSSLGLISAQALKCTVDSAYLTTHINTIKIQDNKPSGGHTLQSLIDAKNSRIIIDYTILPQRPSGAKYGFSEAEVKFLNPATNQVETTIKTIFPSTFSPQQFNDLFNLLRSLDQPVIYKGKSILPNVSQSTREGLKGSYVYMNINGTPTPFFFAYTGNNNYVTTIFPYIQ